MIVNGWQRAPPTAMWPLKSSHRIAWAPRSRASARHTARCSDDDVGGTRDRVVAGCHPLCSPPATSGSARAAARSRVISAALSVDAGDEGDNRLDDGCGHSVRVGQRRSRSIDEGRNAAGLIALYLFVAGLATEAGVLAQQDERLLVLQIAGAELYTLSVTHVAGLICHLCPRAGPIFSLDRVLGGQSRRFGSAAWMPTLRAAEAPPATLGGSSRNNRDAAAITAWRASQVAPKPRCRVAPAQGDLTHGDSPARGCGHSGARR